MTAHAREAAEKIIAPLTFTGRGIDPQVLTLRRGMRADQVEYATSVIQAAIDAACAEKDKAIRDLNNLLRHVGWGQGEIDSAATVVEELQQVRKAAHWCAANAPGTPVPEWVDEAING